MNGGLKRRASRGRAAVIKLKDHVTGACQDLGEGTAGPAIDDALHVGSAVDVNNGGITLCRIEMAGLEHLIVQQLAVRCGQRAELRDRIVRQVRCVGMLVIQSVLEKIGKGLAIRTVQAHLRRLRGTIERIDIKSSVGRHRDAVQTVFL